MAEKIVSPGVFTNELDQSFLPAAIGDIGACIIGPTVKGPAMVPTVVTSFSEYEQKFGTTIKSGSNYYSFLTSLAAQNYLKHSGKLTVVRIMDGEFSGASATINKTGTVTPVLTLNTLNTGQNQNSTGSIGTNNVIDSGSRDNLRWEVSGVNHKKGTFSLLVRRGDDSSKRKQTLETWNNVSLDPTAKNYVEKMIGSQELQFNSTDKVINYVGDYPQKSKYVRVSGVTQLVDYLDENGNVTSTYSNSSSLFPAVGSGSYGGSFDSGTDGNAGPNQTSASWYSDITLTNQDTMQGYDVSTLTNDNGGTAYSAALDMISNQDEYDINLLMLPGVTNDAGSAILNKAIETCETRGDCFVIADPVGYGAGQASAITQAESYDSNYTAMYWPWVQIQDNNLGRPVWVPPSTVLGGIYSFNDKVAHPWFAPAGLNRGGIDTAIQAETKLTHANRDTMYESSLNPIATFPGQGVTVFGQKTLQKKSSALDRVNVRRLMIKVKKFIAASSRFLVFEQNNSQTRRRFLNIANPYLEQVQSNSGLNAFRVVMDDTNNTPDVVDRNILYGQIFLQPTKTAEFIVLDFTIQPTGASFPE
tara:strand:+ start:845 stop:2605 length:1761 start_codon:yes stop_codon:yes gene_type:complete